MIDIEKKVIVLCYANFCRSPVAEKILNQKGFKKIEFTSYGIDPLPYSKMDDRSINYLSNINIIDTNHIPRKITHTAIKNSSLVLCMDHHLLLTVNKQFPNYVKKIKLFTFKNLRTRIEDPYRFDDDAYVHVMSKILAICEDFNEEDFFNH